MRFLSCLLLLTLPACGADKLNGGPASGSMAEIKREIKRNAEIESLVQTMLTLEDTDARVAAMNKLGALGTVVVPRMIQILDEDTGNDGNGAWAAEVLIMLGSDAAPAAEALAQQLIETTECNATTSTALAAIGKPAVPHLIHALSSKHPESRTWAADALGTLAEHADAAVPTLVKLLDDANDDVRSATIFALRDLGAKAHPAATTKLLALLSTLGPDDEVERSDVVDALAAAVATNPTVRTRLEALSKDDPDEYVRERAADALAER